MDKDIDKRVEWLHSEQFSAASNVFGEPQKTTRIGDEYQAQIPSLMTKNERFQLLKFPVCHESHDERDDQNRFEFGLSIPVTWVHNQQTDKEGTDNDLVPVPIPCSSGEEPWSAIEHDSFILGLYIFGKNLRVVNEFMGNKGTQNATSYYYGKFYRSSEHQKWSMYRKENISKSVPGKKIFRGWRLHELLSRLLSDVTGECKASLTQVIKTFKEGKLSFEKYVFTLRDTIGINLLVQAVAIGKGKHDLISIKTKTRLTSKKIEFTRSSLETKEIVNILKDRIGLSKTRLKEFFWAAVWPRLLTRGWHVEQHTNYAFQNSKNLVFLAPGVTKFSRRSLVKGSQYFDSFSDVLNKVASEPHLLEQETEKELVEPRETQGSDDEQEQMKCVVVDTCLVGVVKVRELTSLTDQPARKLKLVFKQKPKRQRDDNIKTDNTSGEDEAKEDVACSEKKRTRIVIDLNSPRVGRGNSDDDNKPFSAKQSVLAEQTTNQTDDLLTPLANGQRQSRRNRSLTTKALEALENGFMNPKKTRRGPEDGSHRRVRAKTAPVLGCGARYLVDGVFDGSSHMVTESPK